MLGAFQEPRECEAFTQWRQGFTPKEHAEMDDRKRERDWQREMAKEDRKWREDQASLAEERHNESMRTASRVSLLSAVIGFAAALAAVVLAWFFGF